MMVVVFITKCLLLLSATTYAQVFGPFPRTFSACDGTVEDVVISMETDGDERAFQHGDTVSSLPEGITVTGNRPKLNANGLRIFDTASAKRSSNLFSNAGRSVLMIPRKKAPLEDNDNGGFIKFRFEKPLYQLRAVTLFGAKNETSSFIRGKDARDRMVDRFTFPAASNSDNTKSVSPSDYFKLKELEVMMKGPGGVLQLKVKICRGEITEACNKGARISAKGLCVPCNPGLFLDTELNRCKLCPKDTFAPYQGFTSCQPCGENEQSNTDRTGCVPLPPPCPPGYAGPGGENCRRCPVRRITTTAGERQCQLCPEGERADETRTQCVPIGAAVTTTTTATVTSPPGTCSRRGGRCGTPDNRCCNNFRCTSNSGSSEKTCKCQVHWGPCVETGDCCGNDMVCTDKYVKRTCQPKSIVRQ